MDKNFIRSLDTKRKILYRLLYFRCADGRFHQCDLDQEPIDNNLFDRLLYKMLLHGGVAQLARAYGSYP
jgi:hypothetical protein